MRLIELIFYVCLAIIKLIGQIIELLCWGFSLCRKVSWSSYSM